MVCVYIYIHMAQLYDNARVHVVLMEGPVQSIQNWEDVA